LQKPGIRGTSQQSLARSRRGYSLNIGVALFQGLSFIPGVIDFAVEGLTTPELDAYIKPMCKEVSRQLDPATPFKTQGSQVQC